MNIPNESQLICFVDKQSYPSDYRENSQCIRLLGFDPFRINENTSHCTFFTLDIDLIELGQLKSRKGNSYVHFFLNEFVNGNRFALLKYKPSNSSNSYLYRTIGTDEPMFIDIITISFQTYSNPSFNNSKNVFNFIAKNNQVPLLNNKNDFNEKFTLKTFNVGQGMCSLLHSNKTGFFLDLGAGTPIKRGSYLNGIYKNQIIDEVNKLKHLYLILSHPDSDHFRIFCWDKSIRDKIKIIYVPENTTWNLSKDIQMSADICQINSMLISGINMKLKIHRTSPIKVSSKNDNALICDLTINGNSCIFLGDYVYKKLITDQNSSISKLPNKKYNYIVVPHHGDSESQYAIPLPFANNNSCVAYFSAGDNKAYGHPTIESITAHSANGYLISVNAAPPEIIIKHQY